MHYDEGASGSIIYAYVYGNPVSYVDPDGLWLRPAWNMGKRVWDDLKFDGPRPSKTKPGEGMVCQVRYKQQPIFRIDVHPIDPVDRTPVPHYHIAPNMEKHRELPSFVGDRMKGILGGGG